MVNVEHTLLRDVLAYPASLLTCANLTKLISVMTHGTQLSGKIFAQQKFKANLKAPGPIRFSFASQVQAIVFFLYTCVFLFLFQASSKRPGWLLFENRELSADVVVTKFLRWLRWRWHFSDTIPKSIVGLSTASPSLKQKTGDTS